MAPRHKARLRLEDTTTSGLPLIQSRMMSGFVCLFVCLVVGLKWSAGQNINLFRAERGENKPMGRGDK